MTGVNPNGIVNTAEYNMGSTSHHSTQNSSSA
jgi:hypothetical protein